MNGSEPQRDLAFYNCNRMEQIVKNYRSKIEKSNDPKKKIDTNEEKEKMKMIWVNKSNDKAKEKIEDGSTPYVGVDPSSNN